MTYAGRSLNEVTNYVKKVEGVKRNGQVKDFTKRAKNSGCYIRDFEIEAPYTGFIPLKFEFDEVFSK